MQVGTVALGTMNQIIQSISIQSMIILGIVYMDDLQQIRKDPCGV